MSKDRNDNKKVWVGLTIKEAVGLNNRLQEIVTHHRQWQPVKRAMKKIRAELDRVDPV